MKENVLEDTARIPITRVISHRILEKLNEMPENKHMTWTPFEGVPENISLGELSRQEPSS